MGNQLFSSSSASQQQPSTPLNAPQPVTSSTPLVVGTDAAATTATTSCKSAEKVLKDARNARKNYQKYAVVEDRNSTKSPTKRMMTPSSSPKKKVLMTTSTSTSRKSSPKQKKMAQAVY